MRNKKINLVHFSSKPGGLEVLIPGLIKNINEFNFSTFIIRPPDPCDQDVYEKSEIKVTCGSLKNRVALLKLFNYGRKHRKEIFHVFNIGPLFLLILRLAGVKKLIYSVHGTIYWKNKKQKIVRKVLWKIALKRDYIVTSNSIFSGSVFKKEIQPSRAIELLYNPIDSKRFKPDSNKLRLSEPIKIIYSGRLAKGKNLIRCIEIAAFLKPHFTKSVFEIYGNGPEKENLRQFIQYNNLESFVFMKGHTSEPEEIYKVADLLIFLSEYESFGNVVVESIMSETPVIAASIPSMKEIFNDFPIFLVDMDGKLDENILNKLSSFERLNFTAKSARTSFIERFDADKHYSKLRDIYGCLTN